MNTDQKLPAESAGERPSTPLFGHAISHAATLIGLFAIVLWGFMAGLVRLVSESFGAHLHCRRHAPAHRATAETD